LPESTLTDAEQLYRRIQAGVSSRPISHAGQLLLSAGIAELRAQDDSGAFFQRADDALYPAEEGGKGRGASGAARARPPFEEPPAVEAQEGSPARSRSAPSASAPVASPWRLARVVVSRLSSVLIRPSAIGGYSASSSQNAS